MNFGGTHIFFGLFFLIISGLLVSVYLAIIFKVGSFCLKLLSTLASKRANSLFGGTLKQIVKRALYFSLIFHLVAYAVFRLDYFGSDNANYKAKEYYVAALPLASFRLVISRFINPDNPIVFPLTQLQELIYREGIKHLPEDDGEIGVWMNKLLLFPYVAFRHFPYGTSDTEPSHGMRELLNRTWFALEAMSTRPFADKQMERENYLENFPFLAYYYYQHNGFYHDRRIGSAFHLLKEPFYVERCLLLYQWLVLLRERWVEHELYEDFKKHEPKIEVFRQTAVLYELSRLIWSSIYTREFDCNSSYVQSYVTARQEFLGDSSPDHVLSTYALQDSTHADRLHREVISTAHASFMKYLLRDFCATEVPGIRRTFYKSEEANKRIVKKQTESLFKNELEILRETYHGSNNSK